RYFSNSRTESGAVRAVAVAAGQREKAEDDRNDRDHRNDETAANIVRVGGGGASARGDGQRGRRLRKDGRACHGDRERRSHGCLLETHLELPVELFGLGSATVIQC